MKLGDTVTWQTTPAHIRTGKIVFVVPAGQSPNYSKKYGHLLYKFLEDNIWSGRCKSELSDGMERNHESYLVEVPAKKEGGKPSIYWPVVKKLKIVKS